jgi:hypothetical protein
MKKIALALFLLTSISLYSQRTVSYVSKNRDTLYLPENSTGRLIYSSWDNVPKKEWPVILFVEETIIAKLNGIKEEE